MLRPLPSRAARSTGAISPSAQCSESLGYLELLNSVSAVAAGADDLRGVEALLTDVVERVVEETRQLAEGLGLEVVLLINLLALLDLIFQSVQSGVNGILQIMKALCRLLLDDVETR